MFSNIAELVPIPIYFVMVAGQPACFCLLWWIQVSFSDTPEKLFVRDTQRDRQASREEWHGVTYICTHELHALIFLIWLFVCFLVFRKSWHILWTSQHRWVRSCWKRDRALCLTFLNLRFSLTQGGEVGSMKLLKGKPNLTAGKNSQLSSLKYVFLHEIIRKENQTWLLERTPSYHL